MKQTCIVTGGSSGIGEAVAKKFIVNDFTVYNLDITPGNYGHYIHCNMADPKSIAQALNQITTEESSIDVVVSNAGIHLSANIEDTSDEAFDKLFEINVKGPIHLTKSCLPIMKKQQSGCFIYVASDQSLIGKRNSFAYNMSKHAVASLTKTTALDYASDGIRAVAVCPGTIETALYHKAIDAYCQSSGAIKEEVHQEESSMQPVGRIGRPEEVAEMVFFFAGKNAGFVTGSLHTIDGGYTAQ